jgi:hypothetical protein
MEPCFEYLKLESSIGVIFKILIPRLFACFIFLFLVMIQNFILFILIYDFEMKEKSHLENLEKDKKLLVDNFPAIKK